jgi:hypothetical protein
MLQEQQYISALLTSHGGDTLLTSHGGDTLLFWCATFFILMSLCGKRYA